MNDHDAVEALRNLRPDGPPPRHDAHEMLEFARRDDHRRGTALTLGGIGATVAAGALGLSLVIGSHPASTQVVQVPGATPTAGPTSAPAGYADVPISPDAQVHDSTVLREDLGADFDFDDRGGTGATLRPGTPTAAGVPAGYTVTVGLMDMGNGDFARNDMCGAMLEKGLQNDACLTRTLPDGRTVSEQWSRWPVGGPPDQNNGQGLRLMYLRPDHALVVLDVTVGEHQRSTTPATRTAVRQWIENFEPRALTAATDQRLQPDLDDGNEWPMGSGTR